MTALLCAEGVVEIIVREGKPQDLPFLRELLFEAACWRADAVWPPRHVGLSHSGYAKLLEGWGREGDTSVFRVGGLPIRVDLQVNLAADAFG